MNYTTNHNTVKEVYRRSYINFKTTLDFLICRACQDSIPIKLKYRF